MELVYIVLAFCYLQVRNMFQLQVLYALATRPICMYTQGLFCYCRCTVVTLSSQKCKRCTRRELLGYLTKWLRFVWYCFVNESASRGM